MTKTDFVALTPHLAMAAGIVLLMLVISLKRNVRLTLATTLVVLLATLGLVAVGTETPHHIAGFMVIDGYSAFMSGLFLIAAIVTTLLAHGYLQGRGGEQEEFYLLLLLATLGAMTMASAEHFAAMILGLEILSISLYVLIGYAEEGHPPLEAALKYLVLSGVASTTMLFGVALIYNATGTLLIYELADAALTSPRSDIYVAAGQGMFLAGIAFKLSLVPFHMWTPDVYQGAPAPVTGYLATVSKGAAFAFILRYGLATDVLDNDVIASILGLIAVASMIGGNLLALQQNNVKRILAYSSIAHIGYLAIGLLALAALPDPVAAVEASMIYLSGYFLMTLAAFGVVSVLSSATEAQDAQDIDDYEGLFWRHPLCATVMTIALLALTGIPLTAGFIIKFYLLTAGVEGGLWLLLWALVIGSAIAVYYYLRIIFSMARSSDSKTHAHSGMTFDAMTALVVMGVALIAFGVYPSPLINLVRDVLTMTAG